MSFWLSGGMADADASEAFPARGEGSSPSSATKFVVGRLMSGNGYCRESVVLYVP